MVNLSLNTFTYLTARDVIYIHFMLGENEGYLRKVLGSVVVLVIKRSPRLRSHLALFLQQLEKQDLPQRDLDLN